MRDIALLAFILALLLMGLKRPFLWVLAYIYVDIVMPQKVGWTIITMLPLSLMVFVATFGGWLLLDSKEGSRFSFRQWLIVALMGLCLLTTMTAQYPDSAWEKWDWVWKSLFFAAFLPLALRTRLRIEAAMLFIVLSIGAIAINGGIKTVFGGGGYETLTLLVIENAGIYESSIISTAAIAIIPLVLFLAKRGTIFAPHWAVSLFAAGVIGSCLLIPVGTYARTGLVCIFVLGVLMLRSVRYRFVYAGLAALSLVVAIPFLPQSFLDRMGTITGHESDESASSRLAVWRWTFDYAVQNPLGGGFDAYRANSFTYQMPIVSGEGNSRAVEYVEVTDEARAYHSSYFEMLGEQGWLGLGLWLWLHGLGLWQMERVRRMFRKSEDGRPGWQHDMATALQQAHIVFLVGAMFVGIAYQPFSFMIVGLQCGLWSHVRLSRKAADQAPRVAERLAAANRSPA